MDREIQSANILKLYFVKYFMKYNSSPNKNHSFDKITIKR